MRCKEEMIAHKYSNAGENMVCMVAKTGVPSRTLGTLTLPLGTLTQTGRVTPGVTHSDTQSHRPILTAPNGESPIFVIVTFFFMTVYHPKMGFALCSDISTHNL